MTSLVQKGKQKQIKIMAVTKTQNPEKNLDPLGVSVQNSDPVISLIRDNKWYTTGAITDHVNGRIHIRDGKPSWTGNSSIDGKLV